MIPDPYNRYNVYKKKLLIEGVFNNNNLYDFIMYCIQ